MQKIRYYLPYIPIIGIVYMFIHDKNCVDNPNHYAPTVITQTISMYILNEAIHKFF
jgi:hypothetical protein